MAVEVNVWQIPGHPRSLSVCGAFVEGIRRVGDKPVLKSALNYRTALAGRVGVFYGLAGKLAQALSDYPAQGGTAVYVDLGYWGRKDGGRFSGFHKLSINGRHPTGYFQNVRHSDERAKASGLKVEPWRAPTNGPIVIAGMGPKGARAEGYMPNGWERKALDAMRAVTRRPIAYRPKPNWITPDRLQGASLLDAQADLRDALRGAHALVAHHSNAAVEAAIAGVPVFVEQGVALPIGLSDLTQIESPAMPDGREQWLADIAWTQFSIAEIASGLAWRHLKDEGLVP